MQTRTPMIHSADGWPLLLVRDLFISLGSPSCQVVSEDVLVGPKPQTFGELKGTQTKGAIWPENVENVQIFPSTK